MKEVIEWKRARRDESMTSNRRTFESRCKRYRVIECVGKFSGMGTTWYAMFGDMTISRHSRKAPAIRACQRHLNPPKKRKRKKK